MSIESGFPRVPMPMAYDPPAVVSADHIGSVVVTGGSFGLWYRPKCSCGRLYVSATMDPGWAKWKAELHVETWSGEYTPVAYVRDGIRYFDAECREPVAP